MERILLQLDSNGITLNLMKCFFLKAVSLEWFSSKEGNKPDRWKLEKLKKCTQQKIKKKEKLSGFSEIF